MGVPRVKFEMRPWRSRTDVIASEVFEYGSDVDASDDCDVFTKCAHKRWGRVGRRADIVCIRWWYRVEVE